MTRGPKVRYVFSDTTSLACRWLRDKVDMSQGMVAWRCQRSISAVSQFESRAAAGSDIGLSLLSEYVRALGGALEIHVRFLDGSSFPLLAQATKKPTPRRRRRKKQP